ncbi:MAG: serine/threonine-protein kinase [Sandaracinaceae bacterium]|mgnify:CR=1 FL=1
MKVEDRIGRVLAERYRLDRILGRGGMGVVYAGRHTWTDRPVAVKLLLPAFADQPRVLERFFREAKTTAALRHPNVVDVLDMGEDDDGSAFLVLELLEGEPLSARLSDGATIAAAELLRVLLPALDAVASAHEVGVVHRDLKPDNFFLSRGFRGAAVTKVLDFGVAKLLEGGELSTKTGTMLGTPAYMSPEQARGLPGLGPATDIWSAGAVLFRALSGRLPVSPDRNPTTMLMSLVQEDRPRLSAVWSEAPPPLAEVVDGTLQRDPSARPASMNTLIGQLLDAAQALGISARDPRDPR